MPRQSNTTTARVQQEELQEMLGHPPGWILRSGITLIFFFILVLLLLGWFIRYPDELPARMLISQSTPPHELMPLTSAKVDTILKRDGEMVQAGERVAIFESAANWQHVDSLWNLLQRGHFGYLPQKLQLGSLQGQYATFTEAHKDLKFFKGRAIFLQRQAAAEAEIATLQRLETAHKEQQSFFLQEKKLIQKNLERTQSLYQDGASSALELEEQQKQLLKYEQQLKGLEVTLLQNRVRMQQLKAQIAENQDEYLLTKNELELRLEQARRQLKGGIEEWYDQYILSSPIAGKLELQVPGSSYQTIQPGQLIGMVVPPRQERTIAARLRLPAAGIGKIAIGAPVKISLDAYPAQEYGQINAQVNEISLVPTPDGESLPVYTLKANLPDTLQTTYGKIIPVQPNMPGTATVITKDRRILERILQQFMNVLKNN